MSRQKFQLGDLVVIDMGNPTEHIGVFKVAQIYRTSKNRLTYRLAGRTYAYFSWELAAYDKEMKLRFKLTGDYL